MHKKVYEEAGPQDAEDSPMPRNQHDLIRLNYARYADKDLTEGVT